MKTAYLAALAALLVALPGTATAVQPSEPAQRDHVPGEWIVKYRDGVHPASLRAHADSHGIELITQSESPLGRLGLLRMRDAHEMDHEPVIMQLQASELVEYAEPNYRRRAHDTRIPDDPRFDEQWYLHNPDGADVDMPRAWDIHTGSDTVVLAIIDEAFAVDHPDLAANMGPGRCFSDCEEDASDPRPRESDQTHGTQVAGVAAAVGDNGVGISGAAWTTGIMPLRTDLTVSSIVNAIDHAIENGAHIINASYGGARFSQAEFDAIERALDAGILFVTSAGNHDSDNDKGRLSFPQFYDLPNIVTVAASGQEDRLARWSQYGQSSVALAAPGIGMLTTATDGSGNPIHRYHSGTSYSAPLVAGIAALLRARFPGISLEEKVARLVAGAELPGALRGRVQAGRANAWRSLRADLLDEPVIVVDAIRVDDDTARGNANGMLDAGEDAVLQVQLESLWGGVSQLGGELALVEPAQGSGLEIRDDHAVITSLDESLGFPVRVTEGLTGNHRLLFRLELEHPDGRTESRWFRHELSLLEPHRTLDQPIGRDDQDEYHAWHVEVPQGASNLRFHTESLDEVDIDLLASHAGPPGYLISLGANPESDSALFAVGDDVQVSGRQDGNELLTIAEPEPGTWHLVVVNYAQRLHEYRISASWCEDATCPGRIRFMQADFSAAASQDAISITVVREGGASGPASVRYASGGGSAEPGTDYEPVSDTLTWEDGDSSARSFNVQLNPDRPTSTVSRTIHLQLDDATGAVLAPPSLRAVINLQPPPANEPEPPPRSGGGGLLGPLWLACILGLLLYRRRRAGTMAA